MELGMLETLNKGTIVISVFSHQETVVGEGPLPKSSYVFSIIEGCQ